MSAAFKGRSPLSGPRRPHARPEESFRLLQRPQGQADAGAASPQINALEPQIAAPQRRRRCAPRPTSFAAASPTARPWTSCCNEAFAVVREAAKRTLGQRHYDVQLVGGMVLHHGGIAEMRTGEGKTLVATLPVYLNALAGKGVHVVTVNDYLASRDAEWMGQIYRFLGLSVGVIVNGLSPGRAPARLPLRHHLRHQQRVRLRLPARQPGLRRVARWSSAAHHFAIVDEVDSILIDEARTPLIISGPTEDRSEFYRTIDKVVRELIEDPDDLRPRREAAPGHADRVRLGEDRGDAGGRRPPGPGFRRPLRSGQRLGGPPRQPGAAGQRALPARPRLHRQAPAR